MSVTLPILTVQDGVPMADSREIAATFGKKHQHVLEAYRNLHCSDLFRRSNFRPFKIKDLTGESTSHVLMTKNGFAFLVLGFTGSAASVFKEQYVERFDAMEEELRGISKFAQTPAVPQTLPEALRLAADLAETAERQAAQIAVLAPRSEALATIADVADSWAIRDCAKLLQTTEKLLRAYLAGNGWIYRRGPGEPWRAHASREQQGWMTTRLIPVETNTGRPWTRPQARITPRGVTILAMRLNKPVPPEIAAQGNLSLPAPARA